MSGDQILEVVRSALLAVVFGSTVLVLPGLIVGLLVAIFQAATQINESTLSFFPKLMVMLVMLGILSPWMMHHLVDYTTGLLHDIPYLVE